MKKNGIIRAGYLPVLIKLLLMIKLVIILILSTTFQAFAFNGFSQRRINLNIENQSISSILKSIESKYEYTFFYSDALRLNSIRMNLMAKNATIDHVMEHLLKGTQLHYEKVSKGIVVIISDVAIVAPIPIQGRVFDENGAALAGVSIIEKGTPNGTTTAEDGTFSLSVANVNALLEISSTGFLSQTVSVQDNNYKNIVLLRAANKLDEVVVVGYGQQKKANLTGSVSSVNIADITKGRPITNLSRGLAGLAAGVHVNSANNRPGNDNANILVRGQGTLNNSGPFILIDGVEGNISTVNPEDIETISILKDASSSAIYGSRAANGVILITTKQGRNKPVSFSYNGFFSSESVANTIEPVSNYADYMLLMNEGFTNSGQPKRFSQDMIDKWRSAEGTESEQLQYPNTDWRKAVLRTANATTHNISASGGSEKLSFFSSFRYNNNPGVIEKAGVKRYDFRTNINAKISNWLALGTMLNGSLANLDYGSQNLNALFQYAAGSNPGYVLRSPDGRYGAVSNVEDNAQSNNVLWTMNNTIGEDKIYNASTRFYTVLSPVKGLTINSSFTYRLGMEKRWGKPAFLDRWNFLTNSISTVGAGRTYLNFYDNQTAQQFMDVSATYQKRFLENLDMKVMAGASQEQYRYQSSWGDKQDLIDPSLSVFDGATGPATLSGNKTEWAMRSYFGRLNLGWADKYLAEFNLRSDGSSRFLGKNRWGYFPSASVGWRIDQESFMKPIVDGNLLNSVKIRASYGSLGNNAVGDYEAQSVYGIVAVNPYNLQLITNSANYVLNGVLQPGLAKLAIANAVLTWERTILTDIGVDFGMFNNRLSGVVDYFHKKTVDILIDLPAPLVHGTAALPKQNAGTVLNKGLEISLEWKDQLKTDLSYYVRGNVSFIKNKVLKFKGQDYNIVSNGIIQEGLPIQAQYLRIVDRIVQTPGDLALVQKMIDNNPNAFPQGRPELGDLLYKDLTGDGIINDDDRQAVGHGPNPTLLYGASLGVEFKGFDLAALIQGVSGIKVFYNDEYYTSNVRYGYQINRQIADGRWYPGIETTAKYPRFLDVSNTKNIQPSDMWLVDKSYLKIRNIQLGYTLPRGVLSRAGLKTFRIYGSLENFFTFTNFPGIDPEVTGVPGVTGINYPSMRQVVLGVNLSF